MKIEKRHIIFGVLAIVSTAVALAYWQYTRLMNYKLSIKKVKPKQISSSKFDLDLFLNFENRSVIAFDFIEQEYKVYINNEFVTTAKNNKKVSIAPSVTSTLDVNVVFDPSKALKILKKNWVAMLVKPELVMIKIDMKLKIMIYGFKVSVPYTYQDTLKNMMLPPVEEV